MLKNIIISIVTLGFVLGSIQPLLAEEEGNSRKGKYTYRKIYKACQKRGEVDTKKPPISPDEKTQAQWKRIFDKKKFKMFGCTDEWNALSESDLLNVYAYLHGHAADSPTPAKCK